jgi:hypothetical protein
MRTEPLTLEEANVIVKRSRTFVTPRTVSSIGYNLELAEVPRSLAHEACGDPDIEGAHHSDAHIAKELVRLHTEFMKTASLEDRQRCFLRKAIAHSESVDSDKKWEDHFAAEIEEEFEVPGEIGVIAMRKTPSQLGVRWTDQVVEAALLNILEFQKNSVSAPRP